MLTANPNLAEWWNRWTQASPASRPTRCSIWLARRWPTIAPALAFELIRETVREFPDHERRGRSWATRNQAAAGSRLTLRIGSGLGQVFDERFGWIPSGDVPRYEKGENAIRAANGSAAAEDARLHASIKSWLADRDRALRRDDESQPRSGRAARRRSSNGLNEIWRQVFRDVLHDGSRVDEALSRRHAATARRQAASSRAVPRPRRIQRGPQADAADDRRDARLLLVRQPHRPISSPATGQNDATLYHEATHQLFQEARTAVRDLGRKNNFWVVEAIACYMESLAEHEGYYTLGGADEGRMPAARQRVLEDDFYVPLAEMVTFSRDALQHDPRLPKLYSESSGLTNFLMHDRGDRIANR